MTTKTCRECLRDLPLSAFSVHGISRQGKVVWRARCRECHARLRREQHVFTCIDCGRTEPRNGRKVSYHGRCADCYPAYRQRKVNACRNAWDEKHRTRRFPGFNDAIREIYEQCPAGHEVDHIVPLQGALVSGLHVPWNLQYLPISENRRKRNAFDG